MAEDLICLAKSAKMELLKAKMEKLIEAKIGKKLDQVAEAAVEALLAGWQQKVAEKQACEHYKEKLMAAFKG
jgi:methenyltetrahydromethanopterin cyclohydrolase